MVILLVTFGFLYFNRPPGGGEGDDGTNFFSQWNPFGKKPTPPPPPPPPETPGVTPPVTEIPKTKLLKVSSMPVAGFTVYQKERFKDVPMITPVEQGESLLNQQPATTPTPPPTEFKPNLRYVARTTGNIYQTFADKIDERRFSGTIIPKVYEAYFGAKGESVVMRYLKIDERTIATFVGSLPKELLGGDSTDTNEVKGSFLPENITDISISPDALKIFYLFNTGEIATGITAGMLGNKKLQVFDSPFTEWLSWWPNSKMITLTTKPSGGVLGYMYAIDPEKKNLIRILGDISGLTTLTSPSGKLVLYSNSNLSLSIYDINAKESSPVSLRTLPEKCVWGKTSEVIYCAVPKFVVPGLYPDTWYQGEVSFGDQLWKIDLATGNTSMLLDPVSVPAGEETDGIKLTLDEAENYLFFVNKKDSYLWLFDLTLE